MFVVVLFWRHRKTETSKDTSHVLSPHPNVCDGWPWAGLEPGPGTQAGLHHKRQEASSRSQYSRCPGCVRPEAGARKHTGTPLYNDIQTTSTSYTHLTHDSVLITDASLIFSSMKVSGTKDCFTIQK